MQNVTLITYPTLTEYPQVELTTGEKKRLLQFPPLGTLSVASLFRTCGVKVQLIDMNVEYLYHIESQKSADNFVDCFANLLADMETEWYGFSTICSSYYITLSIADRLKIQKPSSTIILGGPQASASAEKTMQEFKCIDYILAGEVENSLTQFVTSIKSVPEEIPGLVWRFNGSIVENTLTIPETLDTQPLPAYDLWDQSKYASNELSIEVGRGCPFNCKYCSTSKYFGRRYRLKSVTRIIEEMNQLYKKYKINSFCFIHDNIFHNKRAIKLFYNEWVSNSSTKNLRWGSSLRADLLSPSTVRMLKECNCIGLFIGIETGSDRMQRVIKKNIQLDKAKKAIKLCHDADIATTVAFITGFPEETFDDFRNTLEFYFLMLRHKMASPQFALLSPLLSSDYYNEFRDTLIYDENTSCMAHQGPQLADNFKKIVKAYPDIFAAHYSIPTTHLDRNFLFECVLSLRYATAFSRWLVVLAAYGLGGLYELLALWIDYKKKKALPGKYEYYATLKFQQDFFKFCKSLPTQSGFNSSLEKHLKFMQEIYDIDITRKECEKLNRLQGLAGQNENITEDSYLTAKCIIKKVEYSFRELVDGFSLGKKIEEIGPKESFVAIFPRQEEVNVEEISDLTIKLVRMFKKRKKISEALDRLCEHNPDLLPGGIRNKRAGFLYALRSLIEKDILAVTSPK